MTEIVYQTEAEGYTPRRVANEFAHKYFDKPREVESMDDDKFTLVDGVATYRVELIPGTRLVSLDIYRVIRL